MTDNKTKDKMKEEIEKAKAAIKSIESIKKELSILEIIIKGKPMKKVERKAKR